MMDDVEPSHPDHCTKGQRYAPPPITQRSSPGSVNVSSPALLAPVAWRKAQLEALKALFTENYDECATRSGRICAATSLTALDLMASDKVR
jgi:hypothetical protein